MNEIFTMYIDINHSTDLQKELLEFANLQEEDDEEEIKWLNSLSYKSSSWGWSSSSSVMVSKSGQFEALLWGINSAGTTSIHASKHPISFAISFYTNKPLFAFSKRRKKCSQQGVSFSEGFWDFLRDVWYNWLECKVREKMAYL